MKFSIKFDIEALIKLRRVFDRILDVFAALAALLLIVMMLAVSIKIFFRYSLQTAIIGVDELSEVALIYLTFLGAAWLLRREGHVSIDMLFIRLRPKNQANLMILTSILGAILSLVLVIFGTLATLDTIERNVVTVTILEFPRAAILIIIPIGSLLLMFQFLLRAWSRITNKGTHEDNKLS